MHNKKPRTYALLILLGLCIWNAVECGEFAIGSVLHFVSVFPV